MVDITNIVNITQMVSPKGLGFRNINNVMLITNETPVVDFGTDKFRAYSLAREVEVDWGSSSKAYAHAVKVFAQKPNILAGNGQLLIAPMLVAETLAQAITRLYALVYFGGVFTCNTLTDAEAIAASDVVETIKSIFVLTSNDAAEMETGGLFKTIIDKGNSQTKCLLYTLSASEASLMGAAMVGRAFSVNFSAQNACITMNLKDLIGVSPDTGINQTLYNKAKALGVDLYTDISGLPKYESFGTPFFDQVYNRLWFELTVQTTVFNVLARTSTKIPQTERGMNFIKNAAKKVCEQSVYNGFLAPNTWNGTDTFGNQEDFLRNISDFGYYIYSLPVAQQAQSEREQRIAPVLQIAAKEAGAIHSANILLYFEA